SHPSRSTGVHAAQFRDSRDHRVFGVDRGRCLLGVAAFGHRIRDGHTESGRLRCCGGCGPAVFGPEPAGGSSVGAEGGPNHRSDRVGGRYDAAGQFLPTVVRRWSSTGVGGRGRRDLRLWARHQLLGGVPGGRYVDPSPKSCGCDRGPVPVVLRRGGVTLGGCGAAVLGHTADHCDTGGQHGARVGDRGFPACSQSGSDPDFPPCPPGNTSGPSCRARGCFAQKSHVIRETHHKGLLCVLPPTRGTAVSWAPACSTVVSWARPAVPQGEQVNARFVSHPRTRPVHCRHQSRTRPRCVLPNHLLVIVPVFHPAVPWALATKPVPAPASYLEIRRTPPCSTKCSWPIGARSPF